MTMRDKIASELARHFHEPNGQILSAADGIIAALPGMIPELVWECSSVTDSHHQSKTLFGSYYIERGKDGLFYWWAPFHIGKLHAPTIEAAKTAANAHRRATMCKEMGWPE